MKSLKLIINQLGADLHNSRHAIGLLIFTSLLAGLGEWMAFERGIPIRGFLPSMVAMLWYFTLAVAVALVALVILKEPAVEREAFWRTRPIRWREMATAKLVFIVLVGTMLGMLRLLPPVLTGVGFGQMSYLLGFYCIPMLLMAFLTVTSKSLLQVLVAILVYVIATFLLSALLAGSGYWEILEYPEKIPGALAIVLGIGLVFSTYRYGCRKLGLALIYFPLSTSFVFWVRFLSLETEEPVESGATDSSTIECRLVSLEIGHSNDEGALVTNGLSISSDLEITGLGEMDFVTMFRTAGQIQIENHYSNSIEFQMGAGQVDRSELLLSGFQDIRTGGVARFLASVGPRRFKTSVELEGGTTGFLPHGNDGVSVRFLGHTDLWVVSQKIVGHANFGQDFRCDEENSNFIVHGAKNTGDYLSSEVTMSYWDHDFIGLTPENSSQDISLFLINERLKAFESFDSPNRKLPLIDTRSGNVRMENLAFELQPSERWEELDSNWKDGAAVVLVITTVKAKRSAVSYGW